MGPSEPSNKVSFFVLSYAWCFDQMKIMGVSGCCIHSFLGKST